MTSCIAPLVIEEVDENRKHEFKEDWKLYFQIQDLLVPSRVESGRVGSGLVLGNLARSRLHLLPKCCVVN